MATMIDPCAEADGLDATATLLPADPFTSLRYHFGMLLGVDDFETDQAYHRGKIRLHNAWLHGEGVVWGLGVDIDAAAGELEVLPGLALDAAGRELRLTDKACLSLPLWFAAHRDDPDLVVTDTGGDLSFDAHVVMRFHPCLFRQVPAFADACNGASTSTAYSRVEESVELILRPGPAPVRPTAYHRLRVLFGLEAPIEDNGQVVAADQAVLDAVAAIGALPPGQRAPACREAFIRFAALDGADLRPAQGPDDQGSVLFPATDDCDVILADVRGVTLHPQGDTWTVQAGEADMTHRLTHVATSTIGELTSGALVGAIVMAADAGGPRIDPTAVSHAAKTVTIPVTKALLASTVAPGAFSVVRLRPAGWTALNITTAAYDDPTTTVTLTLGTDPGSDPIRVIAHGTGDTPLLGADQVPLAGAIGGPPGTDDDGHDFVLMMRS